MGTITEDYGPLLLELARKTIEKGTKNVWLSEAEIAELPPVLKEMRGCFVTLNKGGALRGCVGYILPVAPLYQAVIENGYNAAYQDSRFPPVKADEIASLHIEISILTVPERLNYDDAADLLEKLNPGKDGVIISKGYYSATFLPQVWEQLPDREEFLGHLCYKAGLSRNEWRTGELDVEIYHAQAIEE